MQKKPFPPFKETTIVANMSQKRACQLGDMAPSRFPPPEIRYGHPRRAVMSLTTEETGPTTSTLVSPGKKPARLQRRETTSRLLDLTPSPPAQQMLRATTSEPTTSSVSSRQLRPGWKSTKIFGRTMTSGDLLKGIKKLSMASALEETTGSCAELKVPNESKSIKNRLSSLRRKSGGNSASAQEIVTIRVECDESLNSRRDSVIDFSGMGTPPRKKSEDEGIVCKREDLISLINKVAKKQKSPVSPTPKKSLRVTKSASFETKNQEEEIYKSVSATSSREPSRRSSLEKNIDLIDVEGVKEDISPSGSKKLLTQNNKQVKTSPVKGQTSQESLTQSQKQEIQPSATKLKVETGTLKSQMEKNKIKSIDDEEAAEVQWDDDGTNVDAMLLGGAIEAFLKGISGPTTEKKVSFKKS